MTSLRAQGQKKRQRGRMSLPRAEMGVPRPGGLVCLGWQASSVSRVSESDRAERRSGCEPCADNRWPFPEPRRQSCGPAPGSRRSAAPVLRAPWWSPWSTDRGGSGAVAQDGNPGLGFPAPLALAAPRRFGAHFLAQDALDVRESLLDFLGDLLVAGMVGQPDVVNLLVASFLQQLGSSPQKLLEVDG